MRVKSVKCAVSTNNSLILIYKGYSFKKGCLWPSGAEPSAVHSTDGPLKWADLSSVIKLNQVKTKALRITAVIQTALWRRSQLQRRERRSLLSLNRAQWRQSQTAMSCLTATGAAASGFLIWKSHCNRPRPWGKQDGGLCTYTILSNCQWWAFKHMPARSFLR